MSVNEAKKKEFTHTHKIRSIKKCRIVFYESNTIDSFVRSIYLVCPRACALDYRLISQSRLSTKKKEVFLHIFFPIFYVLDLLRVCFFSVIRHSCLIPFEIELWHINSSNSSPWINTFFGLSFFISNDEESLLTLSSTTKPMISTSFFRFFFNVMRKYEKQTDG